MKTYKDMTPGICVPTPDSLQRSLLAEALQISRYLLESSSADADLKKRRQKRLCEIQDALKEFAHPIRREACPVDAIPIAVRQAFVKAAVLVTRYRELGGGKWKGTLHSPSLSKYRVEAVPASLCSEAAIAHLGEIFQLPTEFGEQVTTLVEAVDRQVAQQKQIIQAVLADAGLMPDPNNAPPAAVVDLFKHLFGDLPIPVEAIECLYTPTQLYFCIDYQDSQLRDLGCWNRLQATDQVKLQGFLSSLNEFSFEQFRHFPTFSLCDPAQIDAQWSNRLAQTIGLRRTQMTQALSRSVSIISTQKAEKYLIHDIWGHNWQWMLTQFDGDYSQLANCDEPLRAAETAYTAHGPLTCRELFQVEGEQVTLAREEARLFFHGEVQQRLGLVFTHLIGEMMADVAEFKLIWDSPELTEQMPSSSLFKTEPTKLDLGLADLDFLFLRVLRPLLEVKLSVFEDSVLESDLLTDWALLGYPVQSLELRARLKAAIAQLYQIFLEEYNITYLPTMTGEMGIFAKVVSNMLYLQNAVNSLCTDPTVKNLSNFPFQALLLVFIGSYCSQDSYAEFWEVDDAIANDFLPCWRLLSQTNWQ